jgi:hypothetical protein
MNSPVSTDSASSHPSTPHEGAPSVDNDHGETTLLPLTPPATPPVDVYAVLSRSAAGVGLGPVPLGTGAGTSLHVMQPLVLTCCPASLRSGPCGHAQFNARQASAMCRKMDGYVSFASVEGLGEPQSNEKGGSYILSIVHHPSSES